MAVILAVEPDRQRGKQLAALVRRSTPAEIVVAQSGSAALAAIGTRVPDLILTPPVLAAHDEAVLRTWLRRLGDAAAHVQTLTIPDVAELDAAPRDGGSIFGRLLDRRESAPDSNSEVSGFIEQVRISLERANGDGAAPAGAPDDGGREDFEEISLDTLVLEPFADAPVAPAPRPDPPGPPLDRAATQAWEHELGLNRAAAHAPALWRVSAGLPEEPATAGDGWSRIDPSLPRFQALLKRLEALASR